MTDDAAEEPAVVPRQGGRRRFATGGGRARGARGRGTAPARPAYRWPSSLSSLSLQHKPPGSVRGVGATTVLHTTTDTGGHIAMEVKHRQEKIRKRIEEQRMGLLGVKKLVRKRRMMKMLKE